MKSLRGKKGKQVKSIKNADGGLMDEKDIMNVGIIIKGNYPWKNIEGTQAWTEEGDLE